MVGNVTPEASHSIIGTLSAKPVSMETRASNIDFKTMLELPTGSQRPVLNSTEDDVLGRKSNLFSLEDLVGSDGRGSTVLDSFGNEEADLDPNALADGNIAAEKIQDEFNNIAAGLSLEPFFVPVVQSNKADLSSSTPAPNDDVGTEEIPSILGSTTQLSTSQSNIGVQEIKITRTAKEILKPLLVTNKDQMTNKLAQPDIQTLNLGRGDNKITDSRGTLTVPNQVASAIVPPSKNTLDEVLQATDTKILKTGFTDRTGGENRQLQDAVNLRQFKAEAIDRPVGENLQRNIAIEPRVVNVKETLSDLTRAPQTETQRNIPPVLSGDIQKLVTNPKVLDSVDLRLVNRLATKPGKELQSKEFEVSNSPISAEKRDFTSIKNAGPVFDTAAHLNTVEKNLEMPTTVNPLTNLAAQPTAQKPVSFDWNAPRFAERFAAEVSGMSVNGDSKKFEINPRNLGRLEVSFVARGNSEVIRIEAESDAARDAIIQNSQAIQEMLKSQGRPDLTIRVDVRDTAFAGPQNGNSNLTQQDGAAGRENGSNSANTSKKSNQELANEGFHDPETDDDNGRYA